MAWFFWVCISGVKDMWHWDKIAFLQEEEAEQQRLQRSAGPSGAKALTDQARGDVVLPVVSSWCHLFGSRGVLRCRV